MENVPSLTLSAEEVAQVLGVSLTLFRQRRRALEAAGFPRALPKLHRWSRLLIEIWISANGEAASSPPPSPPPFIEQARQRLEQRYGRAA